jgi:hypothetical protein
MAATLARDYQRALEKRLSFITMTVCTCGQARPCETGTKDAEGLPFRKELDALDGCLQCWRISGGEKAGPTICLSASEYGRGSGGDVRGGK